MNESSDCLSKVASSSTSLYHNIFIQQLIFKIVIESIRFTSFTPGQLQIVICQALLWTDIIGCALYCLCLS